MADKDEYNFDPYIDQFIERVQTLLIENKPIPNKGVRSLQKAILAAATDLGEDLKGKDGLTGHFRRMGKKHPQQFAALMGKIISLSAQSDKPITFAVYDLKKMAALSPEERSKLSEVLEKRKVKADPAVYEALMRKQKRVANDRRATPDSMLSGECTSSIASVR